STSAAVRDMEFSLPLKCSKEHARHDSSAVIMIGDIVIDRDLQLVRVFRKCQRLPPVPLDLSRNDSASMVRRRLFAGAPGRNPRSNATDMLLALPRGRRARSWGTQPHMVEIAEHTGETIRIFDDAHRLHAGVQGHGG